MKKIKRFLEIRHEKHKQKWDTVIGVVGPNGVGKSNLDLHLLENWLLLEKGRVTAEDIKYISLATNDYLINLSEANQNSMVINDEAGEISNRKTMTKLNTGLTIGYQVIRADTIFSVLTLPDIKFLDSYFRNSRVKYLFYVYERGKVKVWLQRGTKELIARNQNVPVFNYNLVEPDFRDSFPVYNGVLAEPYNKLKKEKTTQARKELKELATKNENYSKTLMKESIKDLLDLGYKQNEIAGRLGLGPSVVGRITKELRENAEI